MRGVWTVLAAEQHSSAAAQHDREASAVSQTAMHQHGAMAISQCEIVSDQILIVTICNRENCGRGTMVILA